MCTGKCSRCIAITLYPLVLISIICNILLFFPGWSTKYAKIGFLTVEVYYMGGLFGGGIMMFVSILAAGVGLLGAVYSFVVAVLGLTKGPFCKDILDEWDRPFLNSDYSYLSDPMSWKECLEPKQVVQFNMRLFCTLIAVSSLQGALCVAQMINGLAGCLFGTCSNTESSQVPG